MEQRVLDHGHLSVGEMRTVRVGSMPVLLVRLEDGYHALPARCTHRPRALARATLHGTRLMCPRHQAAFDVRTGDALEPPALDGLPTDTDAASLAGVVRKAMGGAEPYGITPEGVAEAVRRALEAVGNGQGGAA